MNARFKEAELRGELARGRIEFGDAKLRMAITIE
jgi:hypothetical protein